MALVNPSDVQSGIIKYIRYAVGDRLSILNNTTLAAVIRDREKGTRPDYPYIVIDRAVSAKNSGAWLRDQYVVQTDIDTYEVTYKNENTLKMTITCYGEDADDILNQLRVSTLDDIARSFLNDESQSIFQYFSDTEENPTFIETDFVDGATMDIYLTTVSDWTPPESSIIEIVEGEGYYYEGNELVAETVIYVDSNP